MVALLVFLLYKKGMLDPVVDMFKGKKKEGKGLFGGLFGKKKKEEGFFDFGKEESEF